MRFLIILTFLVSSNALVAQQHESVQMTYQHGMKLGQVPLTGGHFEFRQLCTTLIDTVVSTGQIAFMHSKVGKVRDCTLTWNILRDTLISVSIETFDEKQTLLLIKQAERQFGQPQPLESPEGQTLIWEIPGIIRQYAILIQDSSGESGNLTLRKAMPNQ